MRDSARSYIVPWSILIEIVALAVAIILAGGGHGTYHAMRLLFPYTMVMLEAAEHGAPVPSNPSGPSVPDDSALVAFLALFLYFVPWIFALFQYPLYGKALMVFGKYRGTAIVVGIIAVVHIAAAATAFLLGPGTAAWP